MSAAPDRVGFLRHQPDGLVRAIDGALARGKGWINVEPDPDGLDDAAVAALGKPSIFSGRGRSIPLGTLVVGQQGHQLGFDHGSGRHAAQRLREAGVEFPAGTRVVQDHPRRGLVIEVPSTTRADELARILLQTSSQLTIIALGDRWIAEIYPG